MVTMAVTTAATTPSRILATPLGRSIKKKAAHAGGLLRFEADRLQMTITLVPTVTRPYRSITSSLRIRMQPDDTLVPIVQGSLEP